MMQQFLSYGVNTFWHLPMPCAVLHMATYAPECKMYAYIILHNTCITSWKCVYTMPVAHGLTTTPYVQAFSVVHGITKVHHARCVRYGYI